MEFGVQVKSNGEKGGELRVVEVASHRLDLSASIGSCHCISIG
jgi:hypothetical protein